MKKQWLILFFVIHLVLIFFQAFWITIDLYWEIHYNRIIHIPILSALKQNSYTEPYYIVSGINTGYGFYGIKTATEKYFKVTFLDSTNGILKTDRYFNLSTSNGISRLGSYSSYLSNYISSTKELIASKTNNVDSLEAIKLREDYVKKVLKWYGKKEAENILACTSYKVELIAIAPQNVWKKEKTTKPQLYVIQEGIFSVR